MRFLLHSPAGTIGAAASRQRAALVVTVLSVCLSSEVASAQTVRTLDDVLSIARRNSPDLEIARARIDASRANVREARAYPNPTLSVAPGNPFQYSAALPLDAGPQRRTRTRAARIAVNASAFDAADAERRVRLAVQQSFVDLLLVDSLRTLVANERNVFAELLASDSVRVRAGDIPELTLVRSTLDLARADAALDRARLDVRTAQTSLQLLMGIANPDTAFRIAGSLEVRSIAMLETGDGLRTALRPDVQAAHERVAERKALQRYATSLLLPQPQLALLMQRQEPFPGGGNYAVGVALDVPVWNWFGGTRERAAAQVREAVQDERASQLLANSELAVALDRYRVSAVAARRFDSGLLSQARSSLDAARFAYEADAISYVELLDAIRTFGQVNIEAVTAARDYWHSAYAALNAANLDVDK